MVARSNELKLGLVEQGIEELVSGRDKPRPTAELVSIIVPCFGQYEYTRLCVPSVLRHSRQPFELIFIDVGSLDGTAEYLAGLKAASPQRIEVIRADADSGLGVAFELGLVHAKGRFVVLLSNDAIVTAGWLNQLTGLASLHSDIVAVGPMSNYGTPPQLVRETPYRLALRLDSPNVPEDALERFALEWRDQHKGKWFETDHLDTFCLLFKREILGRIGPLGGLPPSDGQRLGPGTLDGRSLGLVIRRAGAKMACCQDLFIHHFGSRQAILAGPKSHETPEKEGLAMTT